MPDSRRGRAVGPPRRAHERPKSRWWTERVVRERGSERHIRFGSEVTSYEFDEAADRWRVRTRCGRPRIVVLVDLTGKRVAVIVVDTGLVASLLGHRPRVVGALVRLDAKSIHVHLWASTFAARSRPFPNGRKSR
ncbi:hypothetical protein DT019_35835 [Streptomyces sp. SDr-06]|uniref:hypothetical protein n=1 Tax=Streptomyces sp. SDr-06 TaxID=2267702 RepID=UPI000DEA2D36|nr:hypothetical protein [Streptomyces sp. SDr-06]RCH61867.1 hypothetical protein DT019_35835 [Streptomyces sp. SDr-06]